MAGLLDDLRQSLGGLLNRYGGLIGNVGGAMPESYGANAPIMDPLAKAVMSTATLPQRAMESSANMVRTGQYDPAPILEAAMLPMGTGAIAGPPMRAWEAVLGAGPIRRLPSMESLQALPHPSVESLNRLSRVESVDLSKARTPQDGVGGMNWEANKRGEFSPPLFEGYADKPVAVRKETGEYVVLDGNHRSVNAINRGDKNLEMYVIDAKDYAPQFAGLKPQPHKMSDDDLLKELFGK
jgi:hypothetical protein